MKNLFKGPDGKLSMMRTMSFFVCVIIMSIFVAHNVVAMINGAGFVSMGFSEAGLVSLVLGAKATQAFAESSAIKKFQVHPEDKE